MHFSLLMFKQVNVQPMWNIFGWIMPSWGWLVILFWGKKTRHWRIKEKH